jgi:16S rRNA (adenine1518-N6/adenine1519-N6)-dimethyltransferase
MKKNGFGDVINRYSNILKSLDIRPNLKLGQIFLINEKIVDAQIHSANITPTDVVLEIGPGLGILTGKLAELSKKVIAIEFDKRLCSYLRSVLPENVELIHGDAITQDFPRFNKLVSNIPYQISSPLIFKLISYSFDSAILMLQKEFADRLVASPNTKHYSRLTVMSSYHYDAELLFGVSSENFLPKPRIDSAVIKLNPKTMKNTAHDEELFSKLVKIVFNERRKMMRNSISNNYNIFKIQKAELKKIILNLPFMDKRPEQITLDQFIQLSNETTDALSGFHDSS